MHKRKKYQILSLGMYGLIVVFGLAISQEGQCSPKVKVKTVFTLSNVKTDYGFGSTVRTDWYTPGELAGGLFVGHPNLLTRNDRAVIKFNLAAYLLPSLDSILIDKAVLQFTVAVTGIAGKSSTRTLEIVHLKEDIPAFSGNDLVRDGRDILGCITVNRKTIGPKGKVFSLDVTTQVKHDIAAGNKYCSFRFRDVQAEARGNPDLQPTGTRVSVVPGQYPRLEIIERK